MYFQIAKRFPGLMIKLLVNTVNAPTVTFEPNKVTVQAAAAVTAYAIQPSSKLTPLFILNLVGQIGGVILKVFVWHRKTQNVSLSSQDTSISAQVSINGLRLAGSLTLNK